MYMKIHGFICVFSPFYFLNQIQVINIENKSYDRNFLSINTSEYKNYYKISRERVRERERKRKRERETEREKERRDSIFSQTIVYAKICIHA